MGTSNELAGISNELAGTSNELAGTRPPTNWLEPPTNWLEPPTNWLERMMTVKTMMMMVDASRQANLKRKQRRQWQLAAIQRREMWRRKTLMWLVVVRRKRWILANGKTRMCTL